MSGAGGTHLSRPYTSSISLRPCSLFVSPKRPSHPLSKNASSFFLRQVIIDAGVLWEGTAPCSHSFMI